MNPLIYPLDAVLIALVPVLVYLAIYAVSGAFACTGARDKLFLATIGGVFVGFIPMWLDAVFSCVGIEIGVTVFVFASLVAGTLAALLLHRKLA